MYSNCNVNTFFIHSSLVKRERLSWIHSNKCNYCFRTKIAPVSQSQPSVFVAMVHDVQVNVLRCVLMPNFLHTFM